MTLPVHVMPTDPESAPLAEAIERVLIKGDLSALTEVQRLNYYRAVCQSLGLNPLTTPFDYLRLSGKTVLYAKRDATEQLRKIHGVSIQEIQTQHYEGVYIVTAKAVDRTGRTDVSTGVVPLGTLKGEALANALMKAETKAKRRVTLSICGLGMLDETELETVKGAQSANYIVEAPTPTTADGAAQAMLSEAATEAQEPATGEIVPPVAGEAQPLRIMQVEAGKGGSRALLVFSDGQELPVYTPQLAALAEHLCQEGVPVQIETKTSAAGKERVEKLSRIDAAPPAGPVLSGESESF